MEHKSNTEGEKRKNANVQEEWHQYQGSNKLTQEETGRSKSRNYQQQHNDQQMTFDWGDRIEKKDQGENIGAQSQKSRAIKSSEAEQQEKYHHSRNIIKQKLTEGSENNNQGDDEDDDLSLAQNSNNKLLPKELSSSKQNPTTKMNDQGDQEQEASSKRNVSRKQQQQNKYQNQNKNSTDQERVNDSGIWQLDESKQNNKKTGRSRRNNKEGNLAAKKSNEQNSRGGRNTALMCQQKLQNKKQSQSGNVHENQNIQSYSILQNQVQPDERHEINTSWDVGRDQAPQSKTEGRRGNRPSRQEQNNNFDRRRGNEQRNNDCQRFEDGGFKKKRNYEDRNQGSWQAYNNNNNEGGKGRGRRREKDDRNFQEKEAGYDRQGRSDYNNGRYGRGGRGGKGHRQYPRRQYQVGNQNYIGRGRQSREENNYSNRDRKGEYQHTNRNYDNNQGGYRNYYGQENNPALQMVEVQRKSKAIYQSQSKQSAQLKPKQKTEQPNAKKLVILPRGLKCWPEMSIFIMQTKLTFSYRQITEHQCDVLIIPYIDTKFQIYPGNIINKCKVDYRKKIQEKGAQISEVGSLYPQKCVGISNFKAIGFLKMGKNSENIKICIAGILPKLKDLKMTVQSVLIPYSKEIGPAKQFITVIIESLSKPLKFTQVSISTNNAADFETGLEAFKSLVKEFMDENKICIS